jgi:hypothetical protein
MADLDRYAIQRDRRFLVRLLLLLVVGAIVGIVVFAKLTSDESMSCVARTMEGPGAPTRAPTPARSAPATPPRR